MIKGLTTVIELIGDVLIADDRARDQLRKQRYIGAEGDDVLLHRRVTAIDVDRIGHRLEGVEADTDRQGDLERGDIQKRQVIERVRQEARVLKEAQQTEIDTNRGDQKALGFFLVRLAVFVDEVTAGVIHDRGEDHQGDEYRLTPAIKDEIDDKEQEVTPAARAQVIEYQHDRQIHKQK